MAIYIRGINKYIIKKEEMMRNYCLLILIVVALNACKNIGVQQILRNDYHKSLSFFGDSLIKHFPREFGYGSYISTVLASTDTIKYFFKIHEMYFETKYPDQEYLVTLARVDSLAKAVYDANDSTLLLVFDYRDKVEIDGEVFDDKATPLEKKLANRNKSTSKSLPVPLFREELGPMYASITYSGFRNGFKLYVLDAASGLFLPSNKLSGSSSLCLPEEWSHGYSRGVALNNQTKEAVYWIVVW